MMTKTFDKVYDAVNEQYKSRTKFLEALRELERLVERQEKQNAALVKALKDLDTRIMPEERKYDEWDYCRIHKDILYGFDAIVKRALALVEGDE